MFPAGAADKLLQRNLEFSPARNPGAVDSIAGPVDIATPNALEAKQDIALQLRSDLLQLIRKPDYSPGRQAPYRSEWPLVLGPFIRGYKLDFVTRFGDSFCKSFQVSFSTTALRITAANESNSNSLCHPERSRGIPFALSCRSRHGIPPLCFASLGMTTLLGQHSPEYL